MKILKMWDADYPWDIRVEKICRTLASHGHELHLMCRNLKGLPSYEDWQYGHIHRLPFFSNRRINYLLSFPAFFNPIWLMMAYKLVTRYHLELILVRDLPLTLTGVAVGCMTGVPVIFDMAENYSYLIEDIWAYELFHPQNYFVRNPWVVRLVEKVAFKLVDRIIVVVEESQHRLVTKGLKDQQVCVVNNTPDLEAIQKMTRNLGQADQNLIKDRYVVIYVGGLEVGRGLELVLQAMKDVVKKIPEILLVIIGTGNSEKMLRNKAEKLGLSEYVFFRGWLDFDKVMAFIQESDVGIIPHYVTNHTNHTIPNKLFDYMAYGLPVIACAAKPIARILSEEECGFIFHDETELCQLLIKLRNEDLRRVLGNRGKKAVKHRYNWDFDSAILMQFLNEL